MKTQALILKTIVGSKALLSAPQPASFDKGKNMRDAATCNWISQVPETKLFLLILLLLKKKHLKGSRRHRHTLLSSWCCEEGSTVSDIKPFYWERGSGVSTTASQENSRNWLEGANKRETLEPLLIPTLVRRL